jgi:hypothetical protein
MSIQKVVQLHKIRFKKQNVLVIENTKSKPASLSTLTVIKSAVVSIIDDEDKEIVDEPIVFVCVVVVVVVVVVVPPDCSQTRHLQNVGQEN